MSGGAAGQSRDGLADAQEPPFMQGLTDTVFQGLNDTQKGFITSIRLLQSSEESGDILLRSIADMFPPSHLFSKELRSLPSVYSELRKFLDTRGAAMLQHSSRRIMMTLASNIYEEQEDKQAAVDIVQEIIAAGRRNREQAPGSQVAASGAVSVEMSRHSGSSSMDKIAHNVAMRLKEKEKKFSGAIGECWMEFVDDFKQLARDYGLSITQKLQYMHNMLRGDAKRFYVDKIDGYATSFNQAVDLIEKEYNSTVRQTKVENYLNTLRISKFVDDGAEISDALAKVHNIINKLSRQGPASHRGEAHKIEFLHQAVVGFDWSKDPLTRIATNNLTFEELYGELENALQLEKEAEIAKLRDNITLHRNKTASENDGSERIFYTGQGRYARSPSLVNSRGSKAVSFGKSSYVPKSFDPLSIAGCFNCDDRNHTLGKFPMPLNMKKATANKLEYYEKKRGKVGGNVHLVLAEICYQLDMSVNASEADSLGTSGLLSDREMFDELLSQAEVSINTVAVEERREQDLPNEDKDQFFTVFEDGSSPRDVMVNLTHEDKEASPFLGACIDTGAQRSVIGRKQAMAYCDFSGTAFHVDTASVQRVYKFGEKRYTGLGTLFIRIPADADHFIAAEVEVVDLDVPFLIGLDFLVQHGMIIDTAHNLLISDLGGWQVTSISKRGHIFLEWTDEMLYTTEELRKMHRHFFHPKAERLYAVMRRSDPNSCAPDDLRDLQEISSSCDVCQRLSRAPSRFRVSLPMENVVFNRILCVDIMYLDSSPVLHCVDRETKFNAAAFLPDETSETAWQTYQSIWSLPYVGHPEHMHADQGPQFKSRRWEGLCHLAGIDLSLSGVEEHNALGEGERYHSYLRSTYRKVKKDFPTLGNGYALQIAVKAVNDTAGPAGLVPTLLVFGVFPRALITTIELPKQKERMVAMQAARDEMARVISKRRISTALRSNVPVGTSSDVCIGSNVLVYRESPVNEWTGPYQVRDVLGKHVFVDIKGRFVKFSIDKTKPYIENQNNPENDDRTVGAQCANVTSPTERIPSADDYAEALDGLLAALRKDMDSISLSAGETIENSEFFTDEVEAYMTKILCPDDPAADNEKFRQAKFSEVQGLKDRNTWTVVDRRELSKGANILGGRFVLTLKDYGTHNETPKARYVAQGHKDKEKEFLVHNTTNLRQRSIRIIVSFAAVKKYRIFSHDVRQAYLQSEEELTREIFVSPKKKDLQFFQISSDEVLALLKPLYGNGDAGDYWAVTFDKHAKKDLGMTPLLGDPSLYIIVPMGNRNCFQPDNEPEGCMGVYVDDSLLAGNETFQELSDATLQKFESRERKWDDLVFFGCTIETLDPGVFKISQPDYIAKLNLVPADATFDQYRSFRAEVAWATHTRPDISCCANRAAQVVAEPTGNVSEASVKLLNSAIKKTKSTPTLGLRYGKLQYSTLHLRVYTDASFGTNNDLTSQLGYLVLLCDAENNCHILDFSSKKCKRVVRSILGGEVYAFTEGFDCAYMIKHDLEVLYGKKIPLQMRTDSKQMFDVVTKASSTSERRLMIDIAATREAYNANEISNVGLVRSEHNVADGLTKPKFCRALDDLLRTGLDNNPVQQWVIRTAPRSSF